MLKLLLLFLIFLVPAAAYPQKPRFLARVIIEVHGPDADATSAIKNEAAFQLAEIPDVVVTTEPKTSDYLLQFLISKTDASVRDPYYAFVVLIGKPATCEYLSPAEGGWALYKERCNSLIEFYTISTGPRSFLRRKIREVVKAFDKEILAKDRSRPPTTR